jgi:1-acyl-sn-glycerol-3-phosphate acyltransferase
VDVPDLPTPDERIFPHADRLLRRLARYHRHRVLGLDNVPRGGRALLVVNHSLATYDIMLLGRRIWKETGRAPRGLGDRAIFRTPGLGELARRVGVVEADPGAARSLLDQNEIVVVAPGGMQEALRSSDRRYELTWSRRRGFVRLAIQARAPLVLAACPRADDVFTIYENKLTDAVYERFRWPAPLLRGLAGLPIPRPVPLLHLVAAPMDPPSVDPDDEDAVVAFHAEVVERMRQLMADALALSDAETP